MINVSIIYIADRKSGRYRECGLRKLRRKYWLVCIAALLLTGPAEGFAHDNTPPHRVLIVYETESGQAATMEFATGLRRGLDADEPTQFEVFSEYLDSVRFPGQANLDRMAAQMVEKYAATTFDAVIAVGPTAVDFLVDNRDDIAPGVPLFFGAVTERTAAKVAHLSDIKGVVSTFDVKQTLALARQLQPNARQAVVLTGSAPFDRSWQDTARAALGESYLGFEVRYVSDLSIAGYIQAAAQLPRDTAVLILTIYEDAEGQKFVPRDAAAVIAAESAAPVYSVYDTYVGRGALGGHLGTFQGVGAQLGGIVKRQVHGDTDIPKTIASVTHPVVDWRQIERFGINPDLLPVGTEVRFRTPSIWDEYRAEILLTIAVLLIQTATIAALIFQAHRRRAAEAELATGRIELAHLSRASLLGELSGAFAHELNQPLTSILANAQVARQMLADGKADTAELAEILADIEVDNKRAATVISQLRRLLTKGEAVLEPTDLNRVAAATMQLIASDLVTKQTKVELKRSREPVPVLANFAQLQQVVLNMIVNAVDATQHLRPSARAIEVVVRKNGKWGDVAVSDNGTGLPKEMMETAFKPFVSTKQKGLGLGLSICRSIAKAHGGRLRFDAEQTIGVKIILSLPLEGHAHEHHGI
jgi:signal transduction histidine kinase